MSDPYSAAGGQSAPSAYATLYMDREITGMWTQRNPFRDAAVPYLQAKYYSAGRFDSMIDGLNWELTPKLTGARAPGSSIWNSNTFEAIYSFYEWKYIQDMQEIIRVLVSCSDGNVYDASNNGKTTLGLVRGLRGTRFLGVNTELFYSDGVLATAKIVAGSRTWKAATPFSPGTLINAGNPGTVQMALGGITMSIVASSSDGTYVTLYIDTNNVPSKFANLRGVQVTFSGLAAAAALNGNTYPVQFVDSSTLGIFRVLVSVTAYNEIAEATGNGSTGNGATGGSIPAFSATEYTVVADAGQQWKCYGPSVQDWGLNAPQGAPTLVPVNGTRFWQSLTTISQYYAILDNNGNIEIALSTTSGPTYQTGRWYPTWIVNGPNGINTTPDGTILWQSFGAAGVWKASTTFGLPTDVAMVILDSNQNLQFVSAGAGGASGGSEPAWATGIGSTTSDGALTWTCVGPGVPLSTETISYAYSYHAIDGSVSTASPAATIPGGILGMQANLSPQNPVTDASYIQIEFAGGGLTQLDQTWVWRTAQGKDILILEDQIPALFDAATGPVYNRYFELGIPDTSTNGQPSLNALIPAPIADSNDPPPGNITAMAYHLQRVWGIVDNKVVYSGGPDTITGNGNTAFPPLNFIPYPEQPIKVRPITVNNGGMLVETTSNIYIILGTGTPNNPFYTTIYMPNVGILNYNAEDIVGSTLYLMTSKRKFVSLDPSNGYAEQGFPIGDQFVRVTTGDIDSDLYDPATVYITWHEQNSKDTAVYVADGAVGWFRLAPTASPESGFTWSPRRQIVAGTSAVQSVETAPGMNQLLIGPPVGTPGPILFRDDSTNDDWSNGAYRHYPAWVTKGNIVLCQSGEIAEIAHVAIKSTLTTGLRPIVSLLLGEIKATPLAPFEALSITSVDPPLASVGEPSSTYFSDRYSALQNGLCPKCDNFQLKIDYGSQNQPDELLTFAIYGRKYTERGR